MNLMRVDDFCTRTISAKDYIMKINDIRDTVRSLEESLTVSRSLEAERWLRYSNLKTENKVAMDELKKANNRNKNMLNLFRQSVTDVRLGSGIALPEPLRREVQKNWHQKYDALLKQNEQLKREATLTNALIKEKTLEIDNLQEKLLNLGDRLVERNKVVENICKKYLNLKKRKDEQEILLRDFIKTIQDVPKEKNSTIENEGREPSSISNKDASTVRERGRGDLKTYLRRTIRFRGIHESVIVNGGKNFVKP